MEELVVLVDEENNVLGTMPKVEAHQAQTPLHRAFSLFLFNPQKELLLQQRSGKKKTWPLVWSNSCCGHPGFGEENEDAIRRRLKEELGLKKINILGSLPYRYCFSKDGIMENEICPVFFGTTDENPDINPEEVETTRWVIWTDFMEEINDDSAEVFSPWCKEQARLLVNHPEFIKFIG